MNSTPSQNQRVVSGMRPTGQLHLGHYHGVLKNWVDMQFNYECFFFVADWHALTTHYKEPEKIASSVEDMVIDWLATGINPSSATIFIQSQVPEHAELHLLLSMMTPVSWLERVPTYKEQQRILKDRDIATYGFLGYPLLQAADILMYKADLVPVGEDQIAHVELTREVARRFNHIYGREPNFENKAKKAIIKMGKRNARLYRNARRAYQEQGNIESLEVAQAMLAGQQNISVGDCERLLGYLEGTGRIILSEPEVKLTKASKMPGLDGQKMSKSYGNTITLREEPDEVSRKIRTMPTDPARVHRTDPGEPKKCPVWKLHQIYSDQQTCQWVVQGCRTASIGCIDCKKPLTDAIQAELEPIRRRVKEYQQDKTALKAIIHDGSEAAREIARETLDDVIEAMRFCYE